MDQFFSVDKKSGENRFVYADFWFDKNRTFPSDNLSEIKNWSMCGELQSDKKSE